MVHGSEQSARELASALRTVVAGEFEKVGTTLRATNHIYQCDLLYICAREHASIDTEVRSALDKATAALGYSVTASAILSLAVVAQNDTARDDRGQEGDAAREGNEAPIGSKRIGAEVVPALVDALDPMAVIVLDERVCGARYPDALVELDGAYRRVARIPNFFEALSDAEEKRQAWVYMQQAVYPL